MQCQDATAREPGRAPLTNYRRRAGVTSAARQHEFDNPQEIRAGLICHFTGIISSLHYVMMKQAT
ncbi:hypothetical protein [Chloroflexus aurantiacus]